jgi:hypothetical protein
MIPSIRMAAVIRCCQQLARRSATIATLALITLPGSLLAPVPRVSAQQTTVEQRCRDIPRVFLAKSEKWSLTYSWRAGFGPGDVQVDLDFDGKARVVAVSRRNEGGPVTHTRTVRLPPDVVAKLAQQIDDTGLLCETPQLRPRMMFDLGRFAVRVRQGAYDKEIYIDECHGLQNGAGFSAVAEILHSQEALLGPEVSWGPFATSTGGPCTGP